MRDPQRIPKLLDAIRVEWEKNPDLRLLQLLVNTCDARPNPLFTVEDDELLVRLAGEEAQLIDACMARHSFDERPAISTIDKAKSFLLTFRCAVGDRYRSPETVGVDLFTRGVVFEWYQGQHTLAVFINPEESVWLKSWGSRVSSEMEDGEFKNVPVEAPKLWSWLKDAP